MRALTPIIDFIAAGPDRSRSIKHLVRLIERGRPVVIFPEGRISVSGSLMKIYDGAAFVAAKSQATIVPLLCEGAELTPLQPAGKGAGENVACSRVFGCISCRPPSADARAPRAAITGSAQNRRGDAASNDQIARMAVAPRETLYESLLAAQDRFGARKPCRGGYQHRHPDTYRKLLTKTLFVARILENTASRAKIGLMLLTPASARR